MEEEYILYAQEWDVMTALGRDRGLNITPYIEKINQGLAPWPENFPTGPILKLKVSKEVYDSYSKEKPSLKIGQKVYEALESKIFELTGSKSYGYTPKCILDSKGNKLEIGVLEIK